MFSFKLLTRLLMSIGLVPRGPAVSSISSGMGNEGSSVFHNVVLSTAVVAVPASYAFSLGGGTATSGTDYNPTVSFTNGVTRTGGTIVVPVGVSSFTVIVSTNEDTSYEGDETFTISVGNLSNTGTIVDNDVVPSVTSVSTASGAEGTTLVHTVLVAGYSQHTRTYPFNVTGAPGWLNSSVLTFSNGVTLAGGNVSVPSGIGAFTVSIQTPNDAVYAGNIVYTLNVGGASGTGTILDDEAPPVPVILSLSTATQTEGTSLVHTVTLVSAVAIAPATYPFSISGGTASTPSDYSVAPTFSAGVTLSGGNITVPVGVTTFSITVPTTQDTVYEGAETYTVNVGGTTATGTINDDESAPTVTSVSTASGTEGASLVHTITMSGAAQASRTYAFTLGGGTAVAGVDFGALPNFSNGVSLSGGNITVPGGVTSFTATVVTANDSTYTGTRGYTMSVGGASGTGTINDNELAPVPTVASLTSTTGAEGTSLVHTVTLTSAVADAAAVYAFALTTGAATAGTDFSTTPTFSNGVTLSGGNVTVPIGVSTFTVTVATTEDTVFEGTETYSITVGSATSTGTITDNDAVPTVSTVSAASATEGAAVVHTVTMSRAAQADRTYALSITAGTAVAGTDYNSTPTFSNGVTLNAGNITVPSGVTSFTVSVATIVDAIYQGSLNYTLNVGGASGTGTILDDEPAPGPAISSISSETQIEGTSLVHTVVLAAAVSLNPAVYPFSVTSVTATTPSDYTATPTFSNGVTLSGGNITVPIGVSTFTVTVPTAQDTVYEGAETYNITISGSTATGTINDDESAPTVTSVSSGSITEGSNLVHTVTLSGSAQASRVYAMTIGGGTAVAGTDYNATPTFSNGVTLSGGNLTVPTGVTTFTATVATIGDSVYQGSLTYTLTIGGASGTGTITDDDAPSVSSVTSATQAEGTSLVHTVTLAAAVVGVAATYALSISGGTATSGTDYTATPTFSAGVTLSGGVITVPVGVSTFTITVATTDDAVFEGTETYSITVGGVTNTGTLTDNDAAPTVTSVSSASATEGTAVVHTVTMSRAAQAAQVYALSLVDDTAIAGTDYNSTPTFSAGVTLSGGNITVPGGVTSFTVTVATIGDAIYQGSLAYTLNVGGASGTGTINDDESAGAPAVSSVSSVSQNEGTSLVHTVTLASAVSGSAAVYAFSISGGTASTPSDYNATPTFSAGVTLSGGNITVPVGVSTFTVTVATSQDTVYEGNETYTISVGGSTATGTVTDDESVPAVTSVSSSSGLEGANIVHTATITGAAQAARTYPIVLSGGTATSGGVDYTSTLINSMFSNGVTVSGGNITVPAGVTSFTVSIPTATDALVEGNETYTLIIGSASGTGTIIDNSLAYPKTFNVVLSGNTGMTLGDDTGAVTITYTPPPTTTLTPDVVVSSTSGVAPFAVLFDATGTTSTNTTDPFHEVQYGWDFGDVNAGVWRYGAKSNLASKNQALGPVASHVFETPGTYTVSRAFFDGVNTVLGSHTITVTDPEVEWAGTKTVCYSTNTDFAGAPAGCVQVPNVTDVGTAFAANKGTGNKRHLFHSDQVFPSATRITIDVGGPSMIGKFGNGAKPIINATAVNGGFQLSTTATPTVSDWRIVDIEFNGNDLDTSAFYGGGSCNKILFLRNKVHNVKFGWSFSSTTLDGANNPTHTNPVWFHQFIVDNTVNDLVGIANGANGMYLSLERSAVMGNFVNPNNKGEHGIRAAYQSKSVFSHNEITGIPSGRAFLSLRSPDQGSFTFPSSIYGTYVYSEKNYVSDNKFYGGFTTGMSGLGPTNGTSSGRNRDYIWESNFFQGSATTTECLGLAGTKITARNNMFIMGAAGGVAIGSAPLAVAPVPDKLWVYNNSVYAPGTSARLFSIIQNETGDMSASVFHIKNNLFYAPNTSNGDNIFTNLVGATLTTGGNSATTQRTTNPNFSTNPPTAPEHFKLIAGSYGIGNGVAVPVYKDYFGIATLATKDIGAATYSTASAINPVLTQSRVTGVAPLSVFFDATGTTAPSKTGHPFHEIGYSWNFGDASAGSWAKGAKANFSIASPRNTDIGPVAHHLFETPGTYTVTLQTKHSTDNGPDRTVTITVTDPNTVFAATTVCISTGTDFTGAPAGSTNLTIAATDAASTVATQLAAGKRRILFKRGDSFTLAAPMIIDHAGPGMFGAFGTGAKPKFTATANVSLIQVSTYNRAAFEDWRIMDLELDGAGFSNSVGVYFPGSANKIAMARLDVKNYKYAFLASASSMSLTAEYWKQHCYFECDIYNSYGDGGSGSNSFYAGADKLAIMGCNINPNLAGEHAIRSPFSKNSVIAHNSIYNVVTGKAHITMRSPFLNGENPTTSNLASYLEGGNIYTEKMMIHDNFCDPTATVGGVSAIGAGPVNQDFGIGRVRNVIIDSNYILNGDVGIMGQYGTIRNNLFKQSTVSSWITNQHLTYQHDATDLWIYNNSIFGSGTQDYTLYNGLGMIDSVVAVKNNVLYVPAGTKPYDTGTLFWSVTGTILTASNNTTYANYNTGSPNFTVTPPVGPNDWKPTSGYTLNSGALVPVWSDFFGVARPATPDMGAVQH